MPNPTFTRQPVSWFKIAATGQVRKDFGEEADLRSLGEALIKKQLQPLCARPDGTLLCGERRWRAANLVGLGELDVIISDEPLTDSQIRILQLQENLLRKTLTGWDQYQAFYDLLQLNPGWRLKDLSEHLKIDPATVTRVMSVSKCIPGVRTALQMGKIGISDANAISKAPEADQARLLDEKLSGASRDDLERKVRSKKTGETRAKRLRLPLAGGWCVTVEGPNLSMKTVITSLSGVLKAARKPYQEGIGCDAWAAAMCDLASRESSNATV